MRINFLRNLPALILLVGLLCVSACAKKKVRKQVVGTWQIESTTIDGEPSEVEITGTYIFHECSGRENRKGECEVQQEITLSQNGTIETESNMLSYRILKGDSGIELMLDDSIFELDISDDNMTLTSTEEENVVVIKLKRQ